MHRRLLTSLLAIVGLVVLLISPGFSMPRLFLPAQAATTPAFGPTTIVEDQREGAEPDIKVCGPTTTWSYGNCGQNNPYASAPFGFSTTSSWLWRSEDQGKTFKLTPSNNTTGKPDICPGGGDTDLQVSPGATQSSDFLNFIDLQGLTNFSSGTSPDGGTTFTCDPASSEATIVDRQWFGIYHHPGTAGSAVYLDYDEVASPTCAADLNSAGNTFVVQKSLDNGLTYAPPVVADCNDGIAGNMEVNQNNGHVFAVHTSYTSPANSAGPDAVTVDRSTDGGTTWTRHQVFGCTPTATTDCTTGQDFAVLAIDKAGGLYVVWSQAPTDHGGNVTGPSHIYLSYSANEGNTWTTPHQVDFSGTNVDLFPWIAAGNAGAVDIVWYGTSRAPAATAWDPGSQVSFWYPYMTQSLNANSSSPTFSAPVRVAQHSNHWGGICTMGLGCTTGGDRSLADFFQVAIDRAGSAVVIWADTSNNSNTSASGNESALVDEAHQIAGTTLYGTSATGTAVTCGGPGVTPPSICQPDQTGDARYEANNMIGANVPKLDITGSTLKINPKNTSQLDVTMNLASLPSLPNATDTGINASDTYIDYLTSWTYHNPSHTEANFDATGNEYYAYLEVNRGTGAVTAFDGNTCSLDTTKAKYFVYPGQNAITYQVNTANKTIDLFVPRTQVGGPGAGSTLYSVTAHTVGQPGPAGPATCNTRDPNGNNPDPSGQIFNVYDKSPAYTAVLANPVPTATPTPTRTPTPRPTNTPIPTATPSCQLGHCP
jgi:hypothetical protein